MKEIVIIVLIVIGVYLYVRTQKAAKSEKEQAAEQAKPKAVAAESAMKDITPEQSEPVTTPTVEGVSFESKDVESDVQQAAETAIIEPMAEPASEGKAGETEVTVEVKAEPETAQAEIEPEVSEAIKLDRQAEEPEAVAEVNKAVEAKVETKVETKIEEAIAEQAVTPEQVIEAAPVQAVEPEQLAWANAKLVSALTELDAAQGNTAQHLALTAAIAECYKQRKNAEYVEYGAGLSQRYLEVFASYIKAVKTDAPDAEVKGTGMMHLSTLLNDNGQFDSAVSVCKTAIEYGLTDGTVTDFAGRIVRIEKAKAKANKAG